MVFFHFSGFSPTKPHEISKYQDRFFFSDRDDIVPLYQEYSKLLEFNNYNYFQSFKCHYTGIKEQHDETIVQARIKKIPIQKRVIKKLIDYITKNFNIILDYRIFYDRGNLEDVNKYGK